MPQRTANAEWNGDLESGDGHVATESGILDDAYDFRSRFDDGTHTNPEELIGAAHAACFSMALANELSENGFTVHEIDTEATVELDPDELAITTVRMSTRGSVEDIEGAAFAKYAEAAKNNCPVSKALAGVEITVEATLE
jgi:osmotically inducible protein OsmC